MAAALPWMAGAAAPKLYDTGPSQDLALVRFVNAFDKAVTVRSGAAQGGLVVEPSVPVSDYQPARSDSAVTGQWVLGKQQADISLRIASGGSASVVAWPGEGGGIASASFVEAPAKFDAMRASLAFYNADARCTTAGLVAAPGGQFVFDKQAALASARRGVNPVRLSVSGLCNGQPVDGTVDLGLLQAGQRYSVFLVPAGKGQRLIGLQDRIAR